MITDFPIIDISPLSGDPTDPATVAAIAASCEAHGFFVVAGHGVPDEVIDAVDEVTRAFFHLPTSTKEIASAETPFGQRGYRALGRTNTAASRGEDAPADLVETYSVKNVDPAAPYAAHNVWPDAPTDYQEAWTAYWHAMEAVQDRILRAFEDALDLPVGWFVDKFDRAASSLVANYYPPQTEAPLPGQLRRGAHTDYGFMTLLYQDDSPGGLQVEVAPATWVDVPHVPGTLIVNVADLLSHWTNGRWRSSVHRVTNPSPEHALRERISIPFFVNPNDDALVTCFPSCADGSQSDPVEAGAWVRAKLALQTTPAMA